MSLTADSQLGLYRIVRQLRAVLLVALTAAIGCGGTVPTADPVVMIGVDGLEWKVMRPLLEAGRLPTMARLIENGSVGRLDTLTPTISPAIWTTVATGKEPSKHGIEGFVKAQQSGQSPELYTNRDRRTKALWNIFSDSGRTVHVIGWWATFPAERVSGVMVAQTNTRGQITPDGPKIPAKGSVLPGLPGQVTPIERQSTVIGNARTINDSIEELARETFGELAAELPPGSHDAWAQSLWSFRADNIYLQVARQLLRESERGVPDLLMLYFGMPDVVGHRFWRYAFPDEYEHPPTQKEVDNLSEIIAKSYVWVDRAIGEVLESYDDRATVIIASDHGMRAANRRTNFVGREGRFSGDHPDGLQGVFIASGGHARRREALGASVQPDKTQLPLSLPVLGHVLDLAPTVLALQGLELGRDMDGVVLKEVVKTDFLDRHPPEFVDSHDTSEWLALRPDEPLSSDAERERLEQLRALGYLRGRTR